MAERQVQQFLEKLKAEMKRTRTYRGEFANRQTNTFWFSKSVMKDQLLAEFQNRGITHIFEQSKVAEFIDKELEALRKSLSTQAQQVKRTRPEDTKIIANQYAIRVVLAHSINPKTDKGFDNFNKLRQIYTDGLNKFAIDLKEFIRDQYTLTKSQTRFQGIDNEGFATFGVELTNTEIDKGSDLFEGGHDIGVYESRARDALNTVTEQLYPDVADKELLESQLQELGIEFKAIRNDNDDTFSFKIESKFVNQKKGAITRREAAVLTRSINQALARLNAGEVIPELKGSRSMRELKEDQLLEKALRPFEKNNGTVVKTKRVKPKKLVRNANTKDTNKTKRAKTRTPRVHIKKQAGAATSSVARKTPKSNLALDQMSIIAKLNARLPDAIANNMGDPALNNRTGRFASSVRIVNILQTPKGFPSVGYTYLKTPYQTFETGGRQGSVDLDPRKLIDRTIRELAVEYAMGRLFTRRL